MNFYVLTLLKFALLMFIYMTTLAYLGALATYQIGMLIVGGGS